MDQGEPRRDRGRSGERVRRPTGGENEGDRGVYIISVAAELVGVHPQTLRIYERKGLLSPSRTAGNTRRYSSRDIARLQTIQRLTQEGVNLAGVKMIVEMENELDRMRRRMEQMHAEVELAEQRIREEVERVRRQYRSEIVPLADMSAMHRRLRGEADAGIARTRSAAAAVRRRGRPIALGPVERRRGPIAMGPGGPSSSTF